MLQLTTAKIVAALRTCHAPAVLWLPPFKACSRRTLASCLRSRPQDADGQKAPRNGGAPAPRDAEGAGPRRGVAPGSFLDLLARASDRTTGRGFTDMEIANQARALVLQGRKCCKARGEAWGGSGSVRVMGEMQKL